MRSPSWVGVICIALLTLMSVKVNAQTQIVIGAGALANPPANSSTNDHGPIYRSTAASAFDYSIHHHLFTASELASIPSGSTITKISWYLNNGAATVGNAQKMNIYMKNSVLSNLPAPPQTLAALTSGSTLTYASTSQQIISTVGWVDFVLTTPIVYTGGGLEVTIDWDISNVVGSPTTNSFVWRNDLITGKVLSYISSVSGTTLNNARTARAQTKFTYTPCTSSSTNTQVSCDSYTWAENGQTYSTSGTFTATSINGSGCVHTSTLNLTINNSTTTGSLTIYSCTPYTWAQNGNTYTTSGTYTHTSTNANGCINTATLNFVLTTAATVNTSFTLPTSNYCSGSSISATSLTPAPNTGATLVNQWLIYEVASGTCNEIGSPLLTTYGNTFNAVLNPATFIPGHCYALKHGLYSNCMPYTSSKVCFCIEPLANTLAASACDSYTWSCNNVTYTTSGTYTCTSLSTNGCTQTNTLNLTITNVTSSSTNLIKCSYYIWPCSGETYTASGTYTCTSLSVSGCLNTETINLTILPTTLTINENITDVSCNATSNGAISLSVSGGVPPYTYLWSTGATTSSISGLSIDDYQYTVTDNGGCSITNYGVVSKAEPITILDSLTYVTTSGGNNGAIFLTSSNGTAPYTYSINGGVSFQSSNLFTNLTANEYSVVVQDALGCSSSKVVLLPTQSLTNVSDPNNPVVYVSQSMMDALGVWSNTPGVALDSFLNTYPGLNVIDITNFWTDYNGGTYTFAPCRCRPVRTSVTFSKSNVANHNDGAGSINQEQVVGAALFNHLKISRDGGALFPPDISISNTNVGEVSSTVMNLCLNPSNYYYGSCCTQTLNVRTRFDAHIKTEAMFPSKITRSKIIATSQCHAKLTLDIDGITEPILFEDTKGVNNTKLSQDFSKNVSYPMNDIMSLTYSLPPISILNNKVYKFKLASDAHVSVFGKGRYFRAQSLIYSDYAMAFEFAQNPSTNCCLKRSADWTFASLSGPQTQAQLKGYTASFLNFYEPWVQPIFPYAAVNTSSTGIADAGTAVGTLNCPLSIVVTNVKKSCYNVTNSGCATIDGYGGTPIPGFGTGNCLLQHYNATIIPPYPVGYTAQAPKCTPAQFCGLAPGVYYVSISDLNGLTAISSFTITLSNPLTINKVVLPSDCILPTGKITITASGSNSPYTYSRNGSSYQSSNIFNNLPAGSYNLWVKDANGCITTSTAIVTTNDIIPPTLNCPPNISVPMDPNTCGAVLNMNACTKYAITSIPHAPINGTGIPLTFLNNYGIMTDDDGMSIGKPIGFNFIFNCISYNTFYVSSNGFITFSNGQTSSWTPQVMPSTINPSNLIAGVWADLVITGGTVKYFTTAGANKKLVVTYTDVKFIGSNIKTSFQIVLYQTTNVIDIFITSLPAINRLKTQGLENVGGTIANVVPGRNASANWSAFNEGKRFTPGIGATASDNCGVVITNNAPAIFPIGTTNVTWTATDPSGNVSTCTRTVTVVGQNTSESYGLSAQCTYTWPCNNITYTASGTYTCTSLTPCGFVHTKTIDLHLPNTSALDFDGSLDYVTLPYNGNLNFGTGAFTVDCWAKFDNSQQTNPTIVSNRSSSTAGYRIYAQSGRIYVQMNSATYGPFGPTNIYDNVWRHISLTRNAAGFCTVYINCVAQTPTFTNAGNISTSQAVAFGRDAFGSNSGPFHFNGALDEIRIWKKTLTQTQLCDAYNAKCVIEPQTNLVAYYRMNEGTPQGNNVTVTSLEDYSGNGLNGTFNNLDMVGSSSNYVDGIVKCCPNTIFVTNITACDSYTWAANGTTYTASGTFMTTTEILNLIIHPTFAISSTASATGSYTWPATGVTYTASGVYTNSITTPSGCVSTETLYLNIACATCGFTVNLIEDEPITCKGGDNATIQATASLPGNYNFSLDGGVSTNATGLFTNISVGTHVVCATRLTAPFGTACAYITISQPAPLEVTLVTTNAPTCGNNNGMISANITGGTNNIQPYLTWFTNVNGDTLNNVLTNNFATSIDSLGVGTYSILVEDNHGCIANSTIVLDSGICNPILNIKAFIQGYYIGSSLMQPVLLNEGVGTSSTICDSITVELHSASSPYSLVASQTRLLNTNGTSTGSFNQIGSYYIVIKHRNGLQTWSANPVLLSGGIVNYDFTTAANMAYGSNQSLVSPGVWAIFSGDVTSDENIDLSDISLVEIDIANFGFGYLPTDINGDGNVDLNDIPLLEQNISTFIFSNHP